MMSKIPTQPYHYLQRDSTLLYALPTGNIIYIITIIGIIILTTRIGYSGPPPPPPPMEKYVTKKPNSSSSSSN